MRAKSWRSDTSPLIKVLQAMLAAPAATRGVTSQVRADTGVKESIARMQTPVTSVGR